MTLTASKALERSIIAQPADVPATESAPAKNKGGRPSRSNAEAGVQAILDGAAPYAAALLRDHVRKKRGAKSIKPSIQRACEYVIDHAIGKARQKVEHSGGILTYAELAKSATELDSKPRDILADVEEVALKHQGGKEGEAVSGDAEPLGEDKQKS